MSQTTSVAARITRLPRAYEPERGREARAAVPDITGDAAALVEGTAGSAPFLHGLVLKEAGWLPGAFDDPMGAVAAEIARMEELPFDQVNAGLRAAKRRIALLVALCDLGGVWALEDVTGTLSRLADRATHVALRAHVGREIAKGKIPGQTEADVESCGGMFALAMGKHGAYELNYSSDIDLICLFDESRFDPVDRMEARAGFIRATRRAMAALSDLTGDGYVFRTDLRLRPDPSVTPVCFAMEAAERYYESVGRTWERAAYIKARACAGDTEAGARFLADLRPFVWRRHLDFHAIRETHDMRLKIRAHKGLGGALRLEGHNMKLGLGGIREIEFFAQTRQLIAGGRDPELRLRGTVPALEKLAEKGWVEAEAAEVLTADYRAHREVEHRLQMLRDAQTHELPSAPEEFDRLAALMGAETEAMRTEIAERCLRVHELTEEFFAPGEAAPAPDLSREEAEITARWSTYPCLRAARAQEIFERLKPELLARIQRLDKPLEALGHLDGFLAGLPAGVQLFALFEANPQLIDLILDIVSTAPHLARYLSRNAGVLDAVIGGSFFAPWPGRAGLTAELCEGLARAGDYESELDACRRWAKEWHFRVGVHQLRGLISADEAGSQYCDIAAACLAGLFPRVVADFARKHGTPPGQGAMVLGMGSLGAGRLTAASDLDMIVIYDAGGVEQSDGRRPLPSKTYYTRFTQALITAMTAQTAEGRLYEVDMRLRPSGRQGPVATSIESFRTYQREEAWVWEHLALTRGAAIAGDGAVLAEVEAFRRALIAGPKDEARIRQETREMRARLAEAKPGGPWDPKNGPGRMMDIELVAEAAALLTGASCSDLYDQLEAGRTGGWLRAEEAERLAQSYRLMWRLQSAARLLSGETLDPAAAGTGGRDFLLRSSGAASLEALSEELELRAREAAAVIDAVLARPLPAG
ncbi:glutamine-synthetase adenylyltransferase [Celeribacter indicus]|uniref:Glutamate-ammonia-ligase adenylyltransferase n=1 Tax=Celeribacter indicus TaxID=1208324 RepID=A0A0B5E5Q5_9RHOB|nr:glutamine-synthetase adenylyltransferase [Celeribacter indicus]AJE47657.1 glutamate-ammonia-ligase adenylyltransferase [Celeribacter indicus]SDW13404.1 glutamate-ammonia-ligase adenylyltransferase [Celeribacter indicus]